MRRFVFLSLALLLTTFFCFGQGKTQARLIDEFSDQCVESVLARRDSFFSTLGKESGSHGLIIIYGIRELEGRNANFVNYYTRFNSLADKYLKSTIRVVRGKDGDELKVQFWSVPNGVADPEPDKPYEIEPYRTTKRFDLSWADFNRWEGPLDIYSDSFYDLGCWFSPNRALLSKILKENQTLKLHLVVYSGSETKASRAKRVVDFAINDLVRKHKISRKRITSIYGGKRKEPQIEFFIVPENGRLPQPTPDPNRDVP